MPAGSPDVWSPRFSAPELTDRGYDDQFSHGYLTSNGEVSSDRVDGWPTLSIGSLKFWLHRSVAYAFTGTSSRGVLLVGHPIDLDHGSGDPSQIARTILRELEVGGIEAAVASTAYLGGRFTCHLFYNDVLTIVPDSHASQSVYWHFSNGVFTASTHAKLIGDVLGLELNQEAPLLLETRKALSPRGTFHLPGIVTPYLGVRPLIANSLLEVTVSGSTAFSNPPIHRRFYPVEEIPERSFDDAFALFAPLFVEHVRLLSSFGPVGVSLTSGMDSRSTFAVTRHVVHRMLFAFTRFRTDSASREEYQDLTVASRLAYQGGVPFLVVGGGEAQTSSEFDRMFDESFGPGAQARGIAQALYEGLPRGFYEFMSTVAETGSAFYKNREPDILEPRVMASVYGHSPLVGADPRFQDIFAEYAEYSSFKNDSLGNIDPYDFFYWEHRNSRWLANRYHEGDLGHRVVLPYNARAIQEAMLSAPYEDRVAQRFQKRLLEVFEKG